MGGVVKFPGVKTKRKFPADEFLKDIVNEGFSEIIVIGLIEENDYFWFGGNIRDAETIVYLLERAKKQVMEDC